ncbi:helix-turn-helix transcriptional regulator, partial [Streptococcus agalactiae]|nr:helix-turn-helix transcriptional regulator [Streptococcus agalactiae]
MFSERLKSLRKEAKLTQKDIASQFGFSQPAYQQWESGKKKPSAETLEKFASFFN